MKAYKDLEKTQECADGDLVAVVIMDIIDELTQQPPWYPVVNSDDVLDAEYIYD